MSDASKKQVPSTDRQAALVLRLEEALPASALGLLENAEARYAAAVSATTAPAMVTTTTTT
jgi:hypothetical protein